MLPTKLIPKSMLRAVVRARSQTGLELLAMKRKGRLTAKRRAWMTSANIVSKSRAANHNDLREYEKLVQLLTGKVVIRTPATRRADAMALKKRRRSILDGELEVF